MEGNGIAWFFGFLIWQGRPRSGKARLSLQRLGLAGKGMAWFLDLFSGTGRLGMARKGGGCRGLGRFGYAGCGLVRRGKARHGFFGFIFGEDWKVEEKKGKARLCKACQGKEWISMAWIIGIFLTERLGWARQGCAR